MLVSSLTWMGCESEEAQDSEGQEESEKDSDEGSDNPDADSEQDSKQETDSDSNEGSKDSSTGDAEESDSSKGSGDGSTKKDGSSGADDNTDTPGDPGDPKQKAAVCKRWKEAFSDKSEGTWSGDVASCKAGDISKEARALALTRLNYMRWLAQLKEVTTDPALDKKAQECALMMHANGTLSHNPPKSWKCYTDDGASAAGKSNISGAPGVSSVLLYMIDPGNATTLGHRRWIISNRFGPTGLGSTSKSSCMYTIGGKKNGDRTWTAWPPPGIFPVELNSNGWSSMDTTGWSIQSDTIDFAGKDITVTADGADKPVDIAQLLKNFGARHTVKITPKGWKMQSGVKYQVKVAGTEIDYSFTTTSCK